MLREQDSQMSLQVVKNHMAINLLYIHPLLLLLLLLVACLVFSLRLPVSSIRKCGMLLAGCGLGIERIIRECHAVVGSIS